VASPPKNNVFSTRAPAKGFACALRRGQLFRSCRLPRKRIALPTRGKYACSSNCIQFLRAYTQQTMKGFNTLFNHERFAGARKAARHSEGRPAPQARVFCRRCRSTRLGTSRHGKKENSFRPSSANFFSRNFGRSSRSARRNRSVTRITFPISILANRHPVY